MSKKSKLGLLARPAQFLLFLLSGFFPRNNELWVFGAWSGNRLSGNAAAVFRFVDNHKETQVSPVWVSSNAGVRKLLRSEGRTAVHPWSPQGIITCLKAGVYAYDVCGNDINFWLSRGARNVMLRHGTSIKKIGRVIDNPTHHLHRLYHGNIFQRFFLGFLLPWHNTTYDLVIASSKQHAKQASEFYFVAEENIAITGSPRNDILFDQTCSNGKDPAEAWVRECHENGQQVCLYMPTFRDDGTRAFPYPWKKLDEICARQGVNILVRLHPVDRSNAATDDIADLKHLRLHDTHQDPSLLFHKVDCMITDYSSSVYDYILLQKPVIFFCHDLASFRKNSRSLYFDLDQITPGALSETLEHLEASLGDLAAGRLAEQASGARYQNTLELFHKYKDGGSTQRVWKEIRQRFCLSEPRDAD